MADQNDLDEDEELTLHESSGRVCVVRALALERERDRVVVVWWCWLAMGRGCGLEYGLELVLLVVERGIR